MLPDVIVQKKLLLATDDKKVADLCRLFEKKLKVWGFFVPCDVVVLI